MISTAISILTPRLIPFLDFSIAFHTVPHKRVIPKLSQLNIDRSAISWINCSLSARTQFVVANNHASYSSPVFCGVPLGSVIEPLFLIYINGLRNNVSSNTRLFADYSLVYFPIYNSPDHRLLQHDLLTIENSWTQRQMSLNIDKSKLVSFHRRSNPSHFSCLLNRALISPTFHYKYLGIHLNYYISWAVHIKNVAKSTCQSLGFLKHNLELAPLPCLHDTFSPPTEIYISPLESSSIVPLLSIQICTELRTQVYFHRLLY